MTPYVICWDIVILNFLWISERVQIKKKKSLATSHLAYDEMFLYVNGFVIKGMYKGNEKGLEQTASVIALGVSFHRVAPLWISVTAVTDICGSDGPGHCSLEENKDNMLYLYRKQRTMKYVSEARQRKWQIGHCEADTVLKQKGAAAEDRRWFVLNALP